MKSAAAGPGHQEEQKSADEDSSRPMIYECFWCLHILTPFLDWFISGEGSGAYDARPLCASSFDWVFLLPLVCLYLIVTVYGACRPRNEISYWLGMTHRIITLAHVVDLGIRTTRMPALWDHEYWAMLTEISFVICYSVSALSSNFTRIVQVQFGILYTSAAFWKLNTSFFNSKYSCATLLTFELLGAYSPSDLNKDNADPNSNAAIPALLGHAAPALTFLGELAIGSGMLIFALNNSQKKNALDAARLARHVAVFLAVGLHTLVFMMPVNTAGGFSLECMSRLVVFFDAGELLSSMLVHNWKHYGIRITFIVALCAFSVEFRRRMTGISPDAGFVANLLLALLYLGVIWGRIPKTCHSYSQHAAQSRSTSAGSMSAFIFLVVVTILYAFVLPVLNLQQQGASTMYSNLRYYNGSNHYVLNLFSKILPEKLSVFPQPHSIRDATSTDETVLLKVMRSSSVTFNRMCFGFLPPDRIFPPIVLDLVRRERGIKDRDDDKSKNSILQLFPYCMRISHSRTILEPLFQKSGIPEPFVPFLLPAYEVAHALRRAMETSTNFQVELELEWRSAEGDTQHDHQRERILIRPSGATSSIGDQDLWSSCEFLTKDSTRNDTSMACNNDSSEIMQVLSAHDADKSLWGMLRRKFMMPYPQLLNDPYGEEICIT